MPNQGHERVNYIGHFAMPWGSEMRLCLGKDERDKHSGVPVRAPLRRVFVGTISPRLGLVLRRAGREVQPELDPVQPSECATIRRLDAREG